MDNQIQEKLHEQILLEFENSLSFNELQQNQQLVNFMDDNLNIYMTDYLKNPIVEKFNFDKNVLIGTIKNSKKFCYDEKTDLIQLIYKPKRKIIVFRDIPKDKQSKEEIINLLKLANDHNYDQKVLNIENVNELFLVYFEDEETTLNIFKWLEKLKEHIDKLPFYFSAFVKVENLKREWLKMENEDVAYVSNIILDPIHYKPRKISLNNEINTKNVNDVKETNLRDTDRRKSKYDEYDPFLTDARNETSKSKRRSTLKNKYDDYEQPHRNSSVNRRNKAFSIQETISLKQNYPLNKNYDLFGVKSNYKYSLKDITRVFINMNLMKKFEIPEEMKSDFIREIMNEKPRINLDHYNAKKEFIEKKERASTYYELNSHKHHRNSEAVNYRKKSNRDFSYGFSKDEYFGLRREKY